MFVVFTVDEMLELGKIGQSIVFHPGKIFISTWNLSKYNNQFFFLNLILQITNHSFIIKTHENDHSQSTKSMKH